MRRKGEEERGEKRGQLFGGDREKEEREKVNREGGN